MDLLQVLQMNKDLLKQVQHEEQAIPQARRRRKFKQWTCAMFYEEMSDFEFLRTFRFNKDGVCHLTALLGNNF